ncbi:MAG: zinc-binding dehydrogenase, partial [Cyanobacteria bacterium J06639_18]
VAAVKPQVGYHIVDLMSLAHAAPQQVQTMLVHLTKAFEAKQLQPLPHRVFPITAAVSALRHMQRAEHVGKIVLLLEGGNREQGIGNRGESGVRSQKSEIRNQKSEIRISLPIHSLLLNC